MTDSLDLAPVITFVRSLRANNNREWFEAHRPEFLAARKHFEDYVAAIIKALSRTEPVGGLNPKDCIFRMNRDLRFSRDKSPYKPYMGANIAPGGRKSRRLGYYIHIEAADHSIIGGGLYEPEPSQLAAWRASIDRDSRTFRRIIAKAPFRKYFGQVRDDSLKTAPRGYPKDHPDLDLLQLKRVAIWRELSDKQVLSRRFLRETLDTLKAMRPFLRYLQSLTR
jgi:uncharacterized protein (TIGR02453 family)